jgi:hypothetical protein
MEEEDKFESFFSWFAFGCFVTILSGSLLFFSKELPWLMVVILLVYFCVAVYLDKVSMFFTTGGEETPDTFYPINKVLRTKKQLIDDHDNMAEEYNQLSEKYAELLYQSIAMFVEVNLSTGESKETIEKNIMTSFGMEVTLEDTEDKKGYNLIIKEEEDL